MPSPINPAHYGAELAPDALETLQAATRVLAGVALRSLDVLDGAVTLPQFRILAILADSGRTRSAQVARALGIEVSAVNRFADRMIAAVTYPGTMDQLIGMPRPWSSARPAKIWSAGSQPGGSRSWRGSFASFRWPSARYSLTRCASSSRPQARATGREHGSARPAETEPRDSLSFARRARSVRSRIGLVAGGSTPTNGALRPDPRGPHGRTRRNAGPVRRPGRPYAAAAARAVLAAALT
jgi:hypothetical protein